MKRVLVVHPLLTHKGGGDAVAAWAIEALRAQYRLTLATFAPVDCSAINESFGTHLSPSDFELRVAPQRYRLLLRAMPTTGAHLLRALCMRWAQELDREHHYDVMLGTENAMDFHRRGLHYAHDVRMHAPRFQQDMRHRLHRVPAALGAYHTACRLLARSDDAGLHRNVALANSEFTAARLRELDPSMKIEVLYPPVPVQDATAPWAERRADFVGIGRLVPAKNWPVAVDIIERVRALGHDTRLTVIGHRQGATEYQALLELTRTRPWFTLRDDVPRETLGHLLAQHRYGLHTMVDEPFGIAVAELQRAGCVTFVHASAGPVEIVGREPRLTFDSAEQAARNIHSVLTSAALQDTLLTHVRRQAELFSTERFCGDLRSAVDRFLRGDL
jgi:glycosyltransferase involved in cell wall biosynthesis